MAWIEPAPFVRGDGAGEGASAGPPPQPPRERDTRAIMAAVGFSTASLKIKEKPLRGNPASGDLVGVLVGSGGLLLFLRFFELLLDALVARLVLEGELEVHLRAVPVPFAEGHET